MNRHELVPYFHPTQIVLVDDDIDFLGNLSLQLEVDLAYLLFDSTTKALSYINDCQAQVASRDRFFKVGAETDVRQGGSIRNRVSLDTEALLKEMHFTNRFSQISVAMVDYAMPQMNGLQFCERIANPHVKKILFTGVATEAEAVDAFNRGIIDRYIRKSEHKVYDNLNRTIRELQYAHIRDTFVTASRIFDVTTPAFLRDDAVIALMGDLRARYGYVEYYLADDPWGFMLIDGDGRVRRLVLCDSDACAQQLARARAHDAPRPCLDALAHGEVLLSPSIRDGDALIQGDHYGNWQRYARAATHLSGRRDYLWAVFDQSDTDGQMASPISTYNRYLEWLDTVGYSMM